MPTTNADKATILDLANLVVEKEDIIDLLECQIQDLERIIDSQTRELNMAIPRRYDPAEYLD